MNPQLKSILMEVFDLRVNEINIELTMDDVSSWDSLKQMDLVTSLENEFNITLEMLDIVSMKSVKSIIDILKCKGVCLEN